MDHYLKLAPPSGFVDGMTAGLHEALANVQQTTTNLHQNLEKCLSSLDRQEERLLDLANDGTLP